MTGSKEKDQEKGGKKGDSKRRNPSIVCCHAARQAVLEDSQSQVLRIRWSRQQVLRRARLQAQHRKGERPTIVAKAKTCCEASARWMIMMRRSSVRFVRGQNVVCARTLQSRWCVSHNASPSDASDD